MANNDLFLRAARGERTERTPVWLMRQAGRFDPEYLAIRERSGMNLEELFRDCDLATEISLLPKRLGVDAIIFFQDILTPLAPMGAPFRFRPGPVLESPIRTRRDVEALRPIDPCEQLDFIAKTLGQVRGALDGELPLLGFAGAPLTLAVFLVEGGSPSGNAVRMKSLMRSEPRLLHKLLAKLADMTAAYLSMQIAAGADAVQLFESYANLCSEQDYKEFAHPYHVRIFDQLNDNTPTILFAKDCPYIDLMAKSGANVLSIGSGIDLAHARRRVGDRVALQGNVSNQLLMTGTFEEIDEAVTSCVQAGGHQGHILNLGHGILKDTPFDSVSRFIETCKRIRHSTTPPSTGVQCLSEPQAPARGEATRRLRSGL